MSNNHKKELAKLLGKSLTSTEIAVFNTVRAVLILTLAVKKRGLTNHSKADLIELLKTMVEMQKLLLKKIDLYIHFLNRDGVEEIKHVMDLKRDLESMKNLKLYISSILKCYYGTASAKQIGPILSEELRHLTNYYVQKNLLLRKTTSKKSETSRSRSSRKKR